MTVKISPSILAADISNLRGALDQVVNADEIHVDVMDGHFVPVITWGEGVTKAVAENTELPVDVHLMIDDPDQFAVGYAKAGANTVSFHAEAAKAPIRLARSLREAGAKAGIAFNPKTDVTPFLPLLDEFDMVLIMTVEPGYGGQEFLGSTLGKVRKVRNYIDEHGLDVDVQVDGGVGEATIEEAAQAGANIFVAGSAVYGAQDPASQIETLRDLATDSFNKKLDPLHPTGPLLA